MNESEIIYARCGGEKDCVAAKTSDATGLIIDLYISEFLVALFPEQEFLPRPEFRERFHWSAAP